MTSSSPCDYDALPDDIKALCQFVCWHWAERNGKPTKPPLSPYTGRECNAHDPANWTDFNSAIAARKRFGAAGIGFDLTGTEGMVGIDLDKCRDKETGEIAPWAQSLVDAIPTYWEITPSGTGLRAFAYGTLPPGARKRGAVEMYDRGRYLTVTGQHLPGTPGEVHDCSSALLALHAKVFGRTEPEKAARTQNTPGRPPCVDDAALLDKARSNPTTGAHFAALFDRADLSRYGGDHSRADLALCGMLLFWTQADEAIAERLFRQSALMRPKWDARRGNLTYGARTLAKARESQKPKKPLSISKTVDKLVDEFSEITNRDAFDAGCPVLAFAADLGQAGVELARALCAADTKESLTRKEWDRLRKSALNYYYGHDTLARLFVGKVFQMLTEKVAYGSQVKKQQEAFGNLYYSARDWYTIVRDIPMQEWAPDCPVDLHDALRGQTTQERAAVFHEYRQRRFDDNPLTVEQVRARYDLPDAKKKRKRGKERLSDAQALVDAVPPGQRLRLAQYLAQNWERVEADMEAWETEQAVGKAPPSQNDVTYVYTGGEETVQAEPAPPADVDALVRQAERGQLPAGPVPLNASITALDLNVAVLRARDFHDAHLLSLCLAAVQGGPP